MDIIKEFNRVRDIPYRIPLTPDEPDECCTGKAEKLFNLFSRAGYEARYRLCTMKWSQLKLPKEILAIPHDDNSSHTYLEVKLQGEWKIIDATWDKGLKNVLPVNEWDGTSDAKIAVPYVKCLSPEESSEYLKYISTPEAIIADLKVNQKFYQAINEWLEKLRV